MKHTLKIIFRILSIVFAIYFIFVIIGLHGMAIEDHYGDLQDFYYESKDGDIAINKTTFEFGIVDKDWKSISVIKNQKDTIDLYNWVHKNRHITKTEIYRPKSKIKGINEMKYLDIIELIKNSKIKLIIRN